MAYNNVTYDENRARLFFRQELLPEIQDTVFKANPFFGMLIGSLAEGGPKYQAGSQQLQEVANNMSGIKGTTDRLWVEQAMDVEELNGNVATGTGGKAITNDPQQSRTKAIWQLTARFKDIALPSEEYLAAQAAVERTGNYDVLDDLLLREGEASMRSLLNLCGGEVWGTNTNPENGLISLVNGISTSTESATYASYGGQSSATWSGWAGNYAAGTFSNILTIGNADYIDTKMGAAVSALVQNGVPVEKMVWVVGTSFYAKFRDYINNTPAYVTTNTYVTPSHGGTFNVNGGKGLPGWTGLHYAGIPVMMDTKVGAQTANLISIDHLKLKALPNAMFTMSDWQKKPNATVDFARISFVGQVFTTNRRMNYRLVYT